MNKQFLIQFISSDFVLQYLNTIQKYIKIQLKNELFYFLILYLYY